MLQVLVVAEFKQAALIGDDLRQSRPDWRVTPVSSQEALREQLQEGGFDVVVLDLGQAHRQWWVAQWPSPEWDTAVPVPCILCTSSPDDLEDFPAVPDQTYLIYDKNNASLFNLADFISQVIDPIATPYLANRIFAEVVSLTTDAIIIAQDDLKIVYCNPAATEIFGYSQTELVGQPLHVLLPPRYHAIHQLHMARFAEMENPKVSRLERSQLVAQKRDGREIAVEISIMKLQRDGRTYFVAVVHDVTLQKETAASLRQYTRRLEALREMDRAILSARSPEEVAQTALVHLQQLVPFQQACIVAFASNASGIILLATSSDANVTFTHPDYSPLANDKIFTQVLQQEDIFVQDDLQNRGSLTPFEVSLLKQGFRAYVFVPLKVRGEQVGLMYLCTKEPGVFTTDYVDMIRDAARPVAVAIQQARLLEEERTQRQLAETLREVARSLSSTLDQEHVLSIILDQLAHVIDFDNAVVLLLDEEELQLAAQKGVDQTPPCSQIQYSNLSHIREVLNTGNPILIADTATDGRWQACSEADKTHSWLGIPLTVKGIVIGLFSISKEQPAYYTPQDTEFALAFARQAAIAVENAQLYSRATLEIDERRQAEAALQIERALLSERVKERTAELSAANAQLARAVRARDEFLASMSHELRTPLNAILGMTEVLQTGAYGNLTDKQVDMLRTIIRSGYHLLELINDILDIAKIEAGQLALQFFPLPISSICNTCIDLIRPQAVKKQLHIYLDIAETATMVWGDELRLQQVLINLLNNAIKFTPAGGKMGLEVACNESLNTVYFTVWDTGIGMSINDLRQLFSGPNGPKPFVQLDSGLSRQYEGTGLGLSLVYHLTELHGGSLAIKSEVGQGSRLTVALPCQSIMKEANAGDIAPLQDKRRKTILLAEDNELYARTISAYLLSLGYRLIVAHTGLQAVQQARNVYPDLVLLDLQMPEVGGAEALNLIRENMDQDVPIIMWTALQMPGDQDYYLRQGASLFLPKPLHLPDLAAKIAELLAD